MVINLRELNSIIKPTPIQLPKIDEVIDSVAISSPKFLSVVDFYSAFFQVPLHPRSRPYTSFKGPDSRSFMFRRCPFGLCSSPSAMLYVLQTTLAGKLGHTAAIYTDDALLHSRTWKEHIYTIEVLLKTLQINNLTANPKKCLKTSHFWVISWVATV